MDRNNSSGERLSQTITRLLGFPDGEGLRFWEILAFFGLVLGLSCIGAYSASCPDPMVVFGVLSLVGLASCLSGGVLGFLFGVPRFRAIENSDRPSFDSSAFVPNTNLEQISDWLTKIIVGATLVQLRPLAAGLAAIAMTIGGQLHAASGPAATGADMVMFFAGGFMWGYLWCSLRIFQEMSGLSARARAASSRNPARRLTRPTDVEE